MITTRTTFVIGAGASKAYGLPLGTELTDRAQALQPKSDIYQILVAPPQRGGSEAAASLSVDRLNRVLSDLRSHPADSIDAYLESRPDDLQVGKLLIAAVIGEAVVRARQHRCAREEDWLRYVLNEMRQGAPDLQTFTEGNLVTFVTFNFDHVIEDRFTAALEAIYRAGDADVARATERIPVIHVHGKLPLPLPDEPMSKPRPFNPIRAEWQQWILTAAGQINVVLDSINKKDLADARQAMSDANAICFLGFSYHPDNLKRLDIPIPPLRRKTVPRQHVFGSACGLYPGEQERVKGRFAGRITLGGQSQNCLEVLRSFHIFRD